VNILYYQRCYPKLSESWIRNEIKELRNRGHRVVVVSHQSSEIPEADPADRSYDLPSASMNELTGLDATVIVDWFSSPPKIVDPSLHVFALFFSSQAKAVVDSLPFDIDHIHGHFASRYQVAAQYLARSIDATHSVMSHAADLYVSDQKPTRRFLYRNCDKLFTISEYNKRFMKDEATAPVEVNVLPACFDASWFKPTEEFVECRLLTVARHVEKKGIRFALEAVAGMDRNEIEYHIVGDGPLTAQLKSLTQELNIGDSVSFLGRVSDDRIREEFDAAHLFVLPCVQTRNGDRDGIPIAIKEAMAMKTPPVTTTVSGIPEVVDDDCGYLVPPRDTEALRETLAGGLNRSPEGKGTVARERIKNHSSDAVVSELVDHFEQLKRRARADPHRINSE